MNMTRLLSILALPAVLAFTPLAAQETQGFSVGANLNLAGNLDLKQNFTNRTFSGGSLEVSYMGRFAATTVPFRTTLSVHAMPGATRERSDSLAYYVVGNPDFPSSTRIDTAPMNHRHSLSMIQLSGDIYTQVPGIAGCFLVTGISVNKIREDMKMTWATDHFDVWDEDAQDYVPQDIQVYGGTDADGMPIIYKPEVGSTVREHKGMVSGLKMGARFGLEYTLNRNLSASVLMQVVEYGATQGNTKPLNLSWLQVGVRYAF